MRITVAVCVAMDGSKLPLFVIFRGTPGGKIEKNLPDITLQNIVSSVNSKAWMNSEQMQIWYEKVWRPYVNNANSDAALLLDDYKCHKSEVFQRKLLDVNTARILIPPSYTSCLQPCDASINKHIKDRLKKIASSWRRARHAELGPGDRLPTPKRKDILEWLSTIWEAIPTEAVKTAFTASGYVFQESVDYTGATESDSE